MGYDLIAFSGGKAIRGPQCAGLLIGKKEFIVNALLNNSPHEDTLGRGMKVGKEEIVGMVKALECYLNEDYAALEKEWWRRLDAISAELTRVPGVATSFNIPDVANHVPHMHISWDPRKISLSPHDAANALRKGKPSIVLGSSEDGLGMNSFMLKPDEDKIIAAQLVQLFKSHTA
jgi:seryl-tRNA(Sec) selenium transferase